MRAKKNSLIPPELARKISPWTVNTAEVSGVTGKIALTGFTAFFLGGTIGGVYSDHNGFLCLLGPWICPAAIALIWSALVNRLHIRLQRGSPFAKHNRVDIHDPVVMRLESLFNSDEARRHLWHETLTLSCFLFAILGVASIVLRHSLNWAIPYPQNHFLLNRKAGEPGSMFWLSLLGRFLFTPYILLTDYYRWCLTTWAKRESSHPAVKP